MNKLVTLGLAGLLGAAAVAGAAEIKPEDAIKYRQGAFNVIGWNMVAMSAMVKGEKPYDQAAFARHAELVALLAKQPWEGFIKGSDAGHTRVKPEIWSNAEGFRKAAQTFETESARLVEVVKAGEQGAIKTQFGALGKSCKACHDDFRLKEYKQ